MLKRKPVKYPSCYGKLSVTSECGDCRLKHQCNREFMNTDHTQKQEETQLFKDPITLAIFIVGVAGLALLLNHFIMTALFNPDPYSDCCTSDYWLMAKDEGYNDALAGLNYSNPYSHYPENDGYKAGYDGAQIKLSNKGYLSIYTNHQQGLNVFIKENNSSEWNFIGKSNGEIFKLIEYFNL